ncbi:MAG TPA: hypothetical protein VN418_07635 [Gammaproteobacteria bacterium]|nr:hypothetical protein [Gammaproteobacteria bacterium]
MNVVKRLLPEYGCGVREFASLDEAGVDAAPNLNLPLDFSDLLVEVHPFWEKWPLKAWTW